MQQVVNWIQIKVTPPNGSEDDFAQRLSDAGAVAVTFEDAADEPVFEPPPGETPLWNSTRIVGLFDPDTQAERIISLLRESTREPFDYVIENLADRNWTRAWMDDFKPMRFGRSLWICPSWATSPDPSAVNLMLDPGLAFGTGTHPTTALCLRWLDTHPPRGKSVIDYGCGSGILAIAAAALGAHHVWAVDHDPQALDAARGNSKKNKVLQKITTTLPDALDKTKCDLLIANILADPLIRLAPQLAERLSPQGALVLSGVLEAQAPQVMQAYTPWFSFKPATLDQDWALLEGKRHK